MTDLQTYTVSEGMVVSLDYILTIDGSVVDSTTASQPLEYLHGYHNIIPGLEKALTGMMPGEAKEVLLPPSEAYGEVDPAAFLDVDRGQFPPGFNLEIGAPLRVRVSDGSIMEARIHQVGDQQVSLDLNHPLAGKELSFVAKIVGLRPATETELQNGRLGGGCSCGSGCGSGCDSGCDSGTCH